MLDILNYRDLETWQKAMDLVERSYRATRPFPTAELYGLTSQIRRAAVSIPSNVAEGHSRRITKVFANHVTIALGSHGELETCIEISHRLGFLPMEERTAWLDECATVGRLLNGLYRSLERKLQAEGQ